MTYAKITKAQFDEMQIDAGVLLRSFNPSAPSINDSDIICATTGGISLDITPIIEDLSEEVYMMDAHTAEMSVLNGWEVGAEFTALNASAQMIGFALGAADKSTGIMPRYELSDADFSDIWWVGDRLDGGLVAVRFINSLSDEGIDFTAQPNGVGNLAVHITAHTSFDLNGAVPVEIYAVESYPMFAIKFHRYLEAILPIEDSAMIDEQTGMLTIESQSGWTYSLDLNTGTMEVSK